MRRLGLLILLAGLAGCGATGGPTVAGDLRVADTAMAAGTPAVAVQITTAMLAKNPRDTDALTRRARAFIMQGNTAAAEADYRNALQIDGRLIEARLGLGRILVASNPAEAETTFQKAVDADPRNVSALNDLGVARDLQGKHQQAQDAYRQALLIRPDLVSARQNLGLSLAVSGNAAEGVEMLSQLAAQARSDRRAQDDLAVALTLNGRTDDATKVLRQELSADDASKALAGYQRLSTAVVQ